MQFKYSSKVNLGAMKVETKSDDKKYKQNVKRAVSKGLVKSTSYVSAQLREALNTAVESEVWAWPRDTERTFEVVGSPRDIIDTGKLRDSLVINEKFGQTKSTIEVKYTTPYAALMHYGGMVQPYGNPYAATVSIPGRPWITATWEGTHGLTKPDFQEAYTRGFLEAWREVFGTDYTG